MEHLGGLERTSAELLVSGELFVTRVAGSNAALMLKLFDTPNGGAVFGVLDSPDWETPMSWYSTQLTGSCLTYGTDWFLEEVYGRETAPSNSFSPDIIHCLFLDNDGALVWRFRAKEGGIMRNMDFVFGETKERQLGSSPAPIPSFRIWASRSAYEGVRATPIFSYPRAA